MKKIIGALLLGTSLYSYADVDCKAKVVNILDWPSKCDGLSAFKVENGNDKYICSLSTKSDAMVLTAFMGGKTIGLRLSINGETCETLSTHYLKPSYIYIYEK